MKKISKNLFNLAIVLFISFALVTTSTYAGEPMPAGTVLSEDSYVFSLEEAQKLRQQIVTLENELNKKNEVILEYKALELNLGSQIVGLESLVEVRDLQITEYKRMHDIDISRIQRLERYSRFAKAEKWGFLAAGVGITVGAVLIADKIDDTVEGSQLGSSTINTRTIPLFRF